MKLKDACFLEEIYDKPRQHIQKQRHYFANKGPYSQSHGFSSSHVGMWELDRKEDWAPDNWCFCNVVLEKTLERVPWRARSSNQSILKEINPEYSLEGLMLKLQYFGHLMRRANSLENTLIDAGKDWELEEKGGEKGWDVWMASLTQWTRIWANSRIIVKDRQGRLARCSPWGHRVRHNWVTEKTTTTST